MANILERFNTIIKSNINALLDKAEDPAKMIDQYLLDLRESLAEVKKETAGVMAEEARCRRAYEENQRAWPSGPCPPAARRTPRSSWPRSWSWRPRART